jgi:SWIM/SEC-C metal-binding protein
MAKLGSEKRPACVRVQTGDRAKKLLELFTANDKHIIIEISPNEPEDVADVDRTFAPSPPTLKTAKIGRNEPCPCGSGTKFKKCCERLSPEA